MFSLLSFFMFLNFKNHVITLAIILIISSIEIIKCNDNNDTTLTVLETFSTIITTATTIITPKSVNQSALVSNAKMNSTINRLPSSNSNSRAEFVFIIHGLLLVFSNLSLLPAIYIAIKGQFRAEAIIYSFAMVFSAMYHLCDCEGFGYCILPYEMLQFGDFFSATLTLWYTAIIIANVPHRWISSFHLTGAVVYGTLLHFWMTGTWSFIIPAISTIFLVGSFWGYRYYREHSLPEQIYMNNFYAAISLMAIGTIMFASQTIFYFRRLYGISHSIWHITMSFSIALLLPRYPNVDSFWQENLKISTTNESNQSKPPIIAIGKSVNDINNMTMINSKPLPPSKEIMDFNAHVNKTFTGGPI